MENRMYPLKFNNYYNRIIKKFKTLNEYLEAATDYLNVEEIPINFKPGDGMNTTQILNIPLNEQNPEKDIDYLLITDLNGNIKSRWFVIEKTYKNYRQYELKLLRDIVADNYDVLTKSTIYLEKGYINENNIKDPNPLIFNKEDFSANQIKQEEIELKDKSRCKWIVGYMNKNSIIKDEGKQFKSYHSWKNKAASPDLNVESIASQSWSSFIDKKLAYPTNYYFEFNVALTLAPYSEYYKYTLYKNQSSLYDLPRRKISQADYQTSGSTIQTLAHDSNPLFQSTMPSKSDWNLMDTYLIAAETPTPSKPDKYGCSKSNWETAFNLNNKIVYESSTNKYYKIIVDAEPNTTSTSYHVDPDRDPLWYEPLHEMVKKTGCNITKSAFNFDIIINFSPKLAIHLVEIANEGYYVEIYPDEMNQTINEAYNAFAIPVIEDKLFFYAAGDDGTEIINFESTDYNSAFSIAQEILNISNEALDLQLLPYCPLPDECIYEIPAGAYGAGHIQIKAPNGTHKKFWSNIVNSNGVAKNCIYFLSDTQFSTIIPFNDTTDYSTPEKIKECNQLDLWRLSSGDYSSSFEFNPARNSSVDYFEVDCKYKPYRPYIHIAPNFGGLYGGDFNDTRGLVCSNTDYSLGRLTDAWETYERNNINFMNSFNREIEHMDTMREYQRIQEIAGIAAGALSGGSTAALAGSVAGPLGMMVGAGIGAAGSAAAGIADMYISESIYKENKSYSKDQFNFSLQNIQAQPSTMTNSGALNPNNKVFPVLSKYSCKDIEREAFKNKIKWNGMNINVITNNILDYLNPNDLTYIRGQLVYNNGIGEAHEMNSFANELAKGLLISNNNT